jgi:tetratricopeptide (TPR) repeat protein
MARHHHKPVPGSVSSVYADRIDTQGPRAQGPGPSGGFGARGFGYPALTALGLLLSAAAQAGDPQLPSALQSLQDHWAQANYQLEGKARLAAFEALAVEADQVVSNTPGSAEALVWRGIVKSTWAGAKGGLGALSLVKEAKVDLEKAIEIDPNALDGSAWTSLGSLYDQVPGWPMGFGDDKVARQMLEKGLELNPDGIDSHYFYAAYLADEGDWEEAAEHYRQALNAPPRAGRELADQGRRKEVQVALAKAEKELR